MTKRRGPGNRPQERPSYPEPPTSDFERLQSAAQALRATAYAWTDFCEARTWDRVQTAFRNFVSNGASVTFLIRGLRHGRKVEFEEWYAPIQRRLRDDPLFRFFWKLRTDSMKRAAPVLGFVFEYTAPEGVVRVHRDPWIGDDLQPLVVGVTSDSRNVIFPPNWWTYSVKDLPAEYRNHSFGLLMQRYVYFLQDIVRRSSVRFAPDVWLDDP